MKRVLLLVLALAGLRPGPLLAQKPPLTTAQYQADFDFLWATVRDDYAYFDQKQTDWNKVRAYYRPQLDTLRSRRAFVRLLENVLNELYDHHAGLGTNRPDSRRLVPSGADVWAEISGKQAVVRAVRSGFGAAEQAALKPGNVISKVNGIPIEEAIQPFLPRCLRNPDAEARLFALQQLLAGDHRTPREWRVANSATEAARVVKPDEPTMKLENIKYPARLEARRIGTIGYLKINNCLFDNRLIADFDSALNTLQGTKGLILDLRETPSGGNSVVARAIMGRFIAAEAPYQLHELPAEAAQTGVRRRWLELVSPRAPQYTAPLVVLCGRWTGSMGEGLTIGFDALRRATVVGTEMARLRGAIYSYTLPNSGIGFNIPVERLYHVDGRTREEFRPPVYVNLAHNSAPDPALQKALELLQGRK